MVFLKRLELQGFKSFAQKTVFEFPSRVTAVVGPNGSGKSNVIDALRWVLGEREAKQLRGDTLEHLIFAGTPKRPAQGFAKVSLYFENDGKTFPYDAPEIVISRRVDRNGTSSFLLNDEEIRLKDLIPLFARARLGTRGLSMIGQGESDVFVKSSPQDRRLMIEEILGLREFRLKKTQAERRLAQSETNMEKVKAMIDELAPHLKTLRRQKSRFERRTEVADALREFEKNYYSHHYYAYTDAIREFDAPLHTKMDARVEKEQEVKNLESELHKFREHATQRDDTEKLRKEMESFLEERANLERELARCEARIELEEASQSREADVPFEALHIAAKKTYETISDLLKHDDIAFIRSSLESLQKELGVFFKTKEKKAISSEVTNEKKRIEDALLHIKKVIGELKEKEEAIRVGERQKNEAFKDTVELINTRKREQYDIDTEIQNLKFEKQKVELRLEELVREWNTSDAHRPPLESLARVPEGVSKETDWDDVGRKIFRLRAELAAIGEIDEALLKEATESEDRFTFLSKEHEDLLKATSDLKQLIKELDERMKADFSSAFSSINEAFNKYFSLMFGGGKARMILEKKEKPKVDVSSEQGEEVKKEEDIKEEKEVYEGIEIDLSVPKKKIKSLEMLSGGEKTLVSLAALFALISVSHPPFLVLDEIDAALDEENARRFSELIKNFSSKTQFLIVTHNRSTMESADALYGVTMEDDGVSRILSMKLEG